MRYKTIFLSDLHLGSHMCSAEVILGFLRKHDFNELYLVGDIIDGWQINRKPQFSKTQLELLAFLFKLAKTKKIVYIRGNHDDFLDSLVPFFSSDIQFVEQQTYISGKKKFCVIHGDQYDQVCQQARHVAIMGDIAYSTLIKTNRFVNWFRSLIGLPYWSFSAYMKSKVKGAVNFIGDYETNVAQDIAKKGFDGVICGHIHHAEIKDLHGIQYMNCGDGCESCTALVEDDNGDFSIVRMRD